MEDVAQRDQESRHGLTGNQGVRLATPCGCRPTCCAGHTNGQLARR